MSHEHKHGDSCHCVRCRPLERPCDCNWCREYRDTQMNLPNFTKIGHGFYVVRTQAGFKQALKNYVGEDYPEYTKYNDIVGHPDSYPSVVHLDIGYRGSHYIRASCMHVNEFRKGLEKADPL